MAICDYCGEEVTMPYTCGYCNGSFCPKHRLPENHACEGLDKLSEKSKKEGKIYRGISDDLKLGPEEEEDSPRFTTFPFDFEEKPNRRGRQKERFPGSSGGGIFNILKNFFFSNATNTLLFIMIVMYIFQLVVQGIFGWNYYAQTFIYYLAPSQATLFSKP
ncbi:hypothetical protein AKJ50_01900, partial [candidate division MSBL1 archaeon SCGC-AAA382A13]